MTLVDCSDAVSGSMLVTYFVQAFCQVFCQAGLIRSHRQSVSQFGPSAKGQGLFTGRSARLACQPGGLIDPWVVLVDICQVFKGWEERLGCFSRRLHSF